MKLNKQYLFELILEALEDDNLTPRTDFEKLMSALTSDLSNARQAMEMYDIGAYELTPEEDAKANKVMMDIEAREIVTNSDNPGKDLKEIGYDFHQLFMDAYGFTPPKSKEFELWGGKDGEEILSLKTMIGSNGIEFEFWYDQQFSKYIMEPWFRFDTMHRRNGDVSLLGDHIFINEDDIETKVSKEELPSALRSAMGIPWNADVPEWPELPKGQPPAEGSGTKAPVEPPFEGKRKLNKNYLFEVINETLYEDEDESIFQMMSSKLDAFISTPDIENFRSGWNLLESMAGLMSDEEENKLKDQLFVAIMRYKLLKGNEDLAIEIVDSISPKEERMEFEEYLFNQLKTIGNHELAISNALKDLEVDVKAMSDNLMLMTGIFSQEQLEKAKARLLKYGEIEEHFEVDTETGGLLVGPMANKYVTFEKKIEEIFGASPGGDIDVGMDALEGLSMTSLYPRTVKAPMVDNHEMKAVIVYEWSPQLGYGMELTLYPVNRGLPLEEYYGVWISQHEEGPSIGKLQILIQNAADELGDPRPVPGGFTVDEMKNKIKELTGADLNEIK